MLEVANPAFPLLRQMRLFWDIPLRDVGSVCKIQQIWCLDRLLFVLKSKHSSSNDLWAWRRPASIPRMNHHITLHSHSRERAT